MVNSNVVNLETRQRYSTAFQNSMHMYRKSCVGLVTLEKPVMGYGEFTITRLTGYFGAGEIG